MIAAWMILATILFILGNLQVYKGNVTFGTMILLSAMSCVILYTTEHNHYLSRRRQEKIIQLLERK